MWTERQIKRTLSQGFRVARGQALLRTGDVALRTALADTLCSEFDFHDARGRPQWSGYLKALRALEQVGRLMLPPARRAPGLGPALGVAVPASQGTGPQSSCWRA